MIFTKKESAQFSKLLDFSEYKHSRYDKTLLFNGGKGTYNNSLHIMAHPTMNCQLFTIGPASNLNSLTGDENRKYRIFLMKKLQTIIGKPQVLIDLKKAKVKTFLELYNESIEIIFQQPYVSTNGSEMCIILFKFKPLIDIPEEKPKNEKTT